ncbi:MAG: primary replicative helicase [Candidatus Eremiobacteraeota bacterium]|nr:primary replicative helicase [Candidatus Eremiobacteraeota bacterium]
MSDEHFSIDRIPPNDLTAEMALLGSILVDREMMAAVADVVAPQHFHAPMHEKIYIALHALYERGDPLDKVALAGELKQRGMLDKIGGMAYVNSLMDTVPTASSALYYARIVREKAGLRALIHVGGKISSLGFESESDAPGALDHAEHLVKTLRERFESGVRRPATIPEIFRARDEALLRAPSFTNKTCFPALNELIGGFAPGLHVVTAHGKQGKTRWVLQNALWDAETNGDVLDFAAEMGEKDTVEILVELLSGVSILDQTTGRLTELQQEKIAAARAWLERGFTAGSIEIWGNEPKLTSRQIAGEIAAHAKRVEKRGGRLASVIVDVVGELADVMEDLDLAHGLRKRERVKHERQEIALKTLRDAGLRVGVPVIAVMHQNRTAWGKTPTAGTIRDGGNAEASAMNILCLHREDPKRDPERGSLIVELSRFGRERTIDARFTRGLWLDVDCRPPQKWAWFEHGGVAEQTPIDNGLLEYANAKLDEPPITDREVERLAYPNGRITDVDGAPARVISSGYDADRSAIEEMFPT